MKTKMVWMGILMLGLAGCGKEPAFRFETRELSQSEALQLGYADRLGIEEQLARPGSAAAAGLLFNGVAGVVQKLIAPGENRAVATLIGQAVPPRVQPFQLTGGKSESKVYEKKLVSSIARTTLVKIVYKIGYQFGASYKGKGAYITNVKFIPLKVETDALWKLSVSALSEQPVNVGSASHPVAKLGFSLTFTAEGLGSRATTDEFELEAANGKLAETIRELGG